MKYVEVSFRVDPLEPWRDILMAELGELGYESFEEDQDGVKAFIKEKEFVAAQLRTLWSPRDPHVTISHTHRVLEDKNWNAEWEQSFEPITVAGRIRIRAEFHASDPAIGHDIVITPRMAFGTGHHATTQLMIRGMLGMDLTGGHVCDLGCGTAVLAMVAELVGATQVVAIDIDENAVENAEQNLERNGCNNITVEKGDASLLKRGKYTHILANIERNTLVRDMERMTDALAAKGNLLLSGFVLTDMDNVLASAESSGLRWTGTLVEGEWVMMMFQK